MSRPKKKPPLSARLESASMFPAESSWHLDMIKLLTEASTEVARLEALKRVRNPSALCAQLRQVAALDGSEWASAAADELERQWLLLVEARREACMAYACADAADKVLTTPAQVASEFGWRGLFRGAKEEQ